MMAIPGFTAEQSLGTLSLHYHLAGRRRTALSSCLHLMQQDETGNYDTGDGSEDGGDDGTDDGENNITSDGGYDAGCPGQWCPVCKNCSINAYTGDKSCIGNPIQTCVLGGGGCPPLCP